MAKKPKTPLSTTTPVGPGVGAGSAPKGAAGSVPGTKTGPGGPTGPSAEKVEQTKKQAAEKAKQDLLKSNPIQYYIEQNGLRIVTNPDGTTQLVDKSSTPYFAYYTSNGTLEFRAGYNDIKDILLADFKKTGQLNPLFDLLKKKGSISDSTYNTKSVTANDFNSALLYLVGEYTKSIVFNNKAGKDPQKFFSFAQGIVGTGTGTKKDLPQRDINLYDRTVIEALIKDIYSNTTDMAIDDAFLKQETDRYMEQIKTGSLTTVTEENGETVRKTTKPFSEAQVRAELPGRIKAERPQAMAPKNSFDFLAFLDGLGARLL